MKKLTTLVSALLLSALAVAGPFAISFGPAPITATTGTGNTMVLQSSPTLNTPTFVAPALGTPTSGVATNLTGTASGLTAGSVTTNANLTGPIASVGNATSITAQTGTGTTFVMSSSPTLNTPTFVAPTLGAATATTVNKVTITAPASGATLTIADGKTLTASNSVTLAGTDGRTFTMPSQNASSIPYTGTATFANIVANFSASTYSGFKAYATDLNINVISDGTRWKPDGVQVLLHSAIPVGIAPTGSMANNGVVTLGTALDLTYTAGLYLYYPASAIVSGSTAGYYWTVMSTTTAGIVYNNTYTPGTLPVVPAANTAFVTTGPGAFTGILTAQDSHTMTVPANLLGINGGVRVSYTATANNTAGNKSLSTKFGGSSFHFVNSSSNVNLTQQIRFSNRGAANAQVSGTGHSGTNFGSTGAAPNLFAIDGTVNQPLAMNIQHGSAATDWVIVQDLLFESIP